MNFSLSKPQVQSGDVLSGTLLCEFYAITLSNSSTYFSKYKSCCIGLANNSKHQLLNAKCYMNSGWPYQLPHVITPMSTGFFASSGSVLGSGSAGVLTFDLQNNNIPDNTQRLQLMWSIPSLHNIYDLWVNADVGSEQASRELFYKLYEGGQQPGKMPTKAADTPHHFRMDLYDVVVVMSNHHNSIMSVYFEDAPTSGGPHDRMKTFMDQHYKTVPDVKVV